MANLRVAGGFSSLCKKNIKKVFKAPSIYGSIDWLLNKEGLN